MFNRPKPAQKPRRPARPRGSRQPEQAKPPKPVRPIRRLIKMREKAGMSRYMLASMARQDDRYLKRLESGEARNPGRNVLISLGRALVAYTKLYNEGDVDKVLNDAGFAPAPLPDQQDTQPY